MIDFLSVLQWVVKIILVGLIVPLILAIVTGYDQRTYRVLPPEVIVQIAGIRRSVEQLAAKYQPAMFLRSTTLSPPLSWNHISRLRTLADQKFDVTIQSPLKPWGGQDYLRFKFVHKSQGDHQTREIRWKLPATFIANLALIGYPIFRIKPYPISLE